MFAFNRFNTHGCCGWRRDRACPVSTPTTTTRRQPQQPDANHNNPTPTTTTAYHTIGLILPFGLSLMASLFNIKMPFFFRFFLYNTNSFSKLYTYTLKSDRQTKLCPTLLIKQVFFNNIKQISFKSCLLQRNMNIKIITGSTFAPSSSTEQPVLPAYQTISGDAPNQLFFLFGEDRFSMFKKGA